MPLFPRHTAAPAYAPSSGRWGLAAIPRSAWFIADQGVVSLANFAAPILVGRYAGQQELGFYTLGVSLYVVAMALARSLVWTTYTKELHTLDATTQTKLTGSATVHIGLYALATAAVIALVSLGALVGGQADLSLFLAVLAPAAAVMLFREHVRRLAMARLDYVGVLLFDVLVAVTQISLLAWLAAAGRMSAVSASAVVAVSAGVSLGWLAFNRGMITIEWPRVAADWKASWRTSKWLVAASSSVTIGNQGYRWILPALASLAELGRLGAAQIVVQVTNPLVIGLSNYIGPLTAKLTADHGVRELWRYTVRVTLVMLASITAFVTFVAFFGVPLLTLLLGDAAKGVTSLLVVTLTLGALSEALLIPIQAATLNCGQARLLPAAALIRLIVNVSLGYGLVGVFGAEAIGVGMLIGSLVALAWLWRAFAERLDELVQRDEAPQRESAEAAEAEAPAKQQPALSEA